MCMIIFQNGHLECVRWMVSETEAIAELSCTREYPSLIHYAARYGQVTNVPSVLTPPHRKHRKHPHGLSLCRRRSCCGCFSSCRNRQSLWTRLTRTGTRPSTWQLSTDTSPVFRCVMMCELYLNQCVSVEVTLKQFSLPPFAAQPQCVSVL